MRRMTCWLGLVLVLLAVAISAAAQAASPTSQSGQAPANQPPKVQGSHTQPGDPRPPDMVCFGYGPKWSVQFVNGEARYLGINQPDQYFLGDFYYVPEDKTWDWHRANDLAPMNGSYGLSASIQKTSCSDPVRKQTYPYSAQVNLPTGDMVSGCCRKLRPGEAPVGQHGLQPAPGSSQSTTPAGSQAPGSQGTGQNPPQRPQ